MHQLYKIVFWSALVFLGLWLIIPLFRMIVDVEFASDSIKYDYKEFLFFAVPIAILLTLFGTLKSTDNSTKTLGKVIGTVVVALGTMFIMLMSIFTDMCIWSDKQILYENKNKSNVKIIVRDFGCGATDSGPPTVQVFKVQYFSKYFIRATKIDTAEINKSEWTKIE